MWLNHPRVAPPFLLLAAMLPFSATVAQAQSRLTAGERVRVARGWGESYEAGHLVSLSKDSLVVATQDETIALRIDSSVRMQRVVGETNHITAGGLVGLGVGAMVGYVGAKNDEGQDPDVNTSTGGYMLLFGAVGTALGMLVGSLVHSPTWEDVPQPWTMTDASLQWEENRVVLSVPLDGRARER